MKHVFVTTPMTEKLLIKDLIMRMGPTLPPSPPPPPPPPPPPDGGITNDQIIEMFGITMIQSDMIDRILEDNA